MSRKYVHDVKNILERAKAALGIKTDQELAELLNIKQTTLSSWKRRGNIDLASVIALCKDISADWLIYGKGEMVCGEESDIVEKITSMLREMDQESQRDILKYVQKEELLKKLLDKQKVA